MPNPKHPVDAANETATGFRAKRPVRDKRQAPPQTKAGRVLALLNRSKGTSLDEIGKVTGWQAHSVRGFLSATVRKRLHLKLASETDAKGVRRYRIVDSAET